LRHTIHNEIHIIINEFGSHSNTSVSLLYIQEIMSACPQVRGKKDTSAQPINPTKI
jgi:hypothetical protein